MKNKEEMEQWMRDEVSNPMIGSLVRRMLEDGLPLDEVMELIKPIIDNTPKVEGELVEKAMRIQDGERILSTIKKQNKRK
jgi:hypothetical protein